MSKDVLPIPSIGIDSVVGVAAIPEANRSSRKYLLLVDTDERRIAELHNWLRESGGVKSAETLAELVACADAWPDRGMSGALRETLRQQSLIGKLLTSIHVSPSGMNPGR